MIGSKLLQCPKNIRNKDETFVLLRHFRIIDDRKGTTLLESLHGIIVSIKRLALQCEENRVFWTLATIRRNCRMIAINGI